MVLFYMFTTIVFKLNDGFQEDYKLMLKYEVASDHKKEADTCFDGLSLTRVQLLGHYFRSETLTLIRSHDLSTRTVLAVS